MSRLLDLVLSRRGLDHSALAQLDDPSHPELKNMEQMCARLKTICDEGRHLVIITDFDTDGIMSGVIGLAGLSTLGFGVSLFRLNPSDGYGFNRHTVESLVTTYPDVAAVITCDVGITCFEGVDALREKGIEVYITDHHIQPEGRVDDLHADVVVNPNAVGESYPNKSICGAHVIWQVLHAYASRYNEAQLNNIHALRVFAGIGTIADMMELVGENRQLVRDAVTIARYFGGCEVDYHIDVPIMSDPCRQALSGLGVLLETMSADGKLRGVDDLNEEFFGFYLAPTFNAVKRLGENIDIAFGLFFGDNPGLYARALLDINDERKELVARHYEDILTTAQPWAPYIYYTDAHTGIAGLLATKLMGLHGNTHPVLVVCEGEDGQMMGSGRSPSWYKALDRLNALGIYAAGHQGAFGVRFDKDQAHNIVEFFEHDVKAAAILAMFNGEQMSDSADLVLSCGSFASVYPTMSTDGALDTDECTHFVKELDGLRPFGRGFRYPIADLYVLWPTLNVVHIGARGQHVKIVLPGGINAFWWNGAKNLEELDISVCAKLRGRFVMSHFRGRQQVNFYIDEVSGE